MLLAANGAGGPEFLRSLAALVRRLDRGVLPDYRELPMASWEAKALFRRHERNCRWWLESGEHEYPEALRRAAAGEHPGGCLTETALLAAELQYALLLFPGPGDLEAAIAPAFPGASAVVFRDLLEVIHMHFAEEQGAGSPTRRRWGTALPPAGRRVREDSR
ncbi:hypothetical protein OG948_36665 (plasmid) [Embleya sp. NBC_00888]|uniref:hypothetical protein n=1 Tax=Embleya sp. NBC_00888 TaxID=2975960 RepID=UPI002F913DDD|nr:hypothetical protein OG948_36665 [Embleya sp. NBC_00888]